MFDLKTYLQERRQAVNAALSELWNGFEPYPTKLVQAMRYSVEAGGKRLRPILCMAASRAVGGTEAEVMDAACALELIHTYSLIHDDLPAMDNDDIRRGKPTCHKAFDEATAILAGDALLTFAFDVLAAGRLERDNSVDSLARLRVIQLIARAAGASGMVQGQMLDLSLEGRVAGWEDLKILQQLKTGALLEGSVHAGAILGGGNVEQVTALRAYGAHIAVTKFSRKPPDPPC
jgi:geranylgeranyl diphosphate synthase type II